MANQSPRLRMIAELSACLVEAVRVGDVAAARVANETIAKLLAVPGGASAPVIDIGKRRPTTPGGGGRER